MASTERKLAASGSLRCSDVPRTSCAPRPLHQLRWFPSPRIFVGRNLVEPFGKRRAGAVGVAFLAVGLARSLGQGRHQAEVDVHWLEGLGVRAAGDVGEESAD